MSIQILMPLFKLFKYRCKVIFKLKLKYNIKYKLGKLNNINLNNRSRPNLTLIQSVRYSQS